MKKSLTALVVAALVASSVAAVAAPDENQRMTIQQIQAAKQKLAAAQAAQGA